MDKPIDWRGSSLKDIKMMLFSALMPESKPAINSVKFKRDWIRMIGSLLMWWGRAPRKFEST